MNTDVPQDGDELATWIPVDQLPDDEPPAPFSMPWPDGLPEPGFYEDVPYAEYRKWPAINTGPLKTGDRVTALHMKARIDGRMETGDTPDRKLGRAIHCRLLEPTRYKDAFHVALCCTEPIKTGARKGDPCGNEGRFFDVESELWYCGVHAKAHPDAGELEDVLTEEEANRVETITESVYSHEVVSMLRSHGGCEVSAVWEHEGVPAKARFDKLILGDTCPTTIVDVKKIQPMAGTDDALQKAVREWGYDVQAFWYCDAVKTIKGGRPGKDILFAFIFVEDKPPYAVRPIWASKAMLEVGRCKVNKAIGVYQHGIRTGDWPGYPDGIRELDPADWEMRRYGIGGTR